MAYLSVGARVMLSVVFVVAAGAKLRNRSAFDELVGVVGRIGFPRRLAAPAVAALVAVELIAAALVLWPPTAAAGSVLALMLSAVVTIGVVVVVRRGVDARCNCFGAAGGRLNGVHIARNATLTAVAATACLAGTPTPSPSAAVVSACAGLLGGIFLVFSDDLASLARGVDSTLS